MTDWQELELDPDDVAAVSVLDELPLWSAPFGMRLLDGVRLRKGIRALDLGCGSGFPLLELAQRLGPTCRVFGIDPWRAALMRARHKMIAWGVDGTMTVQGVAEAMPFPGGLFDLVVSNNGINNVADVEHSLSECARVARPGAQLLMTVNLDGTMREFYEVFETVLFERGLTREIARMRAHIYHKRRPLEETVRSLENAGFGVEKTEHDAFTLRYCDGTAMLGAFLIRSAFMPPWIEILERGDRAEVMAEVRERLDRVAAENGELRLSIPFVTIDCVRR